MRSFVLPAVLAGSLSSVAHAAFTVPVTRPTDDAAATAARATYQAWDAFQGLSDNAPDVAEINPLGAATLSDLDPTTFVTSTGNLYNFAAPANIQIVVPGFNAGPGFQTQFVLQIATAGGELVLDGAANVYNLQVDGVPVTPTYTELSRASTMGAAVEHLFEFTIDGSAASHTINYQSVDSSTSQQRVSLDTLVVPEPAALSLIPIAGLLLSRRRR